MSMIYLHSYFYIQYFLQDTIKIDVLDKEDGQGNFTDMTQSIAQKVKSGELSVEAIDDQYIDLTLT